MTQSGTGAARRRPSLKTALERSGLLALMDRAGLRAPAEIAWRALTRPETVRQEWDVWADIRGFRRHYAFLGEGHTVPAPGRVALIINVDDFVAQAKEDGMLARALELQGYRPVILMSSWCVRARQYYRTYGFRDFIYLDREMRGAVPAEALGQIEALLVSRPTLQAVKALSYRGVDVGRQVLATLLRGLHQGRVDPADPAVAGQLHHLLVRAMDAVHAAEAILDRVQPSVALVCDGLYVGVGAVVEAAINRSVPVIQWVASQRDDALTLKRLDRETRRVHPWSLSEETWEAVRGLSWTPEHDAELQREFAERYVDGRWSSYYNRAYGRVTARADIQQRLGLDPGKKTAVVFAHILWDSTLFWGEDVFEDYEEWLVETVRAACKNPRLNWVVKLHPQNVWKLKRDRLGGEPLESVVLRRELGALPSHVRLLPADTDISTLSVFAVADYGLTVRGTVGIEMTALGIPVITAGTGRYAGRGFTLDSASRAEYLARLACLEAQPALTAEQTALAKRYAHTLFLLRPARFTSFRPIYRSLEEVGHPLDHDIEIRVRSAEELRAAADLRAFARWVSGPDRDFLAAPDGTLEGVGEPLDEGRPLAGAPA